MPVEHPGHRKWVGTHTALSLTQDYQSMVEDLRWYEKRLIIGRAPRVGCCLPGDILSTYSCLVILGMGPTFFLRSSIGNLIASPRYSHTCFSKGGKVFILEENLSEGSNVARRWQWRKIHSRWWISWYTLTCSLRFLKQRRDVFYDMWLWLWRLECHHPCFLLTEISREWLWARTYGWFITLEWLHADKITRPLMAVLLPKATITHDCIDMEF